MARSLGDKGNEALVLAKALRNGAADKTSGKRLREIIRIVWGHRAYRDFTPEKMVAVMEDLGPTFVKMGQVMSARRDVFPEEYCVAFSTLRSKSRPMEFSEVEKLLNRSFGDYRTVFKHVYHIPLGSASVAQVHKAVLRDGGDVVAVKVRRPGIKKQMTDDVELLRRANDLLEVQAVRTGEAGFDVSAFVDELERTVRNEIDFRKEAENLVDFRKMNESEEHVTSPKVYEDLTSESVLVMEYVDGPTIDTEGVFERMGADPDKIGTVIARNYLKQLLTDGLFHADPHAGNICLLPDQTIEWIDLGMVGRLDHIERGLLRELFMAVVSSDAQEVKRVLLTWGRPIGNVNHTKLLQDIDAMLGRYGSAGISEIDVSAAVNDLLTLIRGQNIAMPPSFIMLARGVVTYEGTLEAIAPNVSIVGSITDYLREHLLEEIDVTGEFEQAVLTARKATKKAVNIPSQISNLLDMASKGELEVHVSARDFDRYLDKLSSTVDRMTLGLIIAGLFIGSSMLCTTAMEPRILGIPIIGFLGYLGALILSIYVVFKGKP